MTQLVYSWCGRYRAPFYLALLTIGMLAVIELQHPYYFLHDDNVHQNLPYYIHNLRAVLAGEFPLFNFHQFLGTPVFSCIQSAALYLPNYGALCLSKLFLGHYFGTMEFIAGFHLLLAVLGFFWLMRSFGLNEWSCCFGAIAWAFCGFVMTAGNSWIQVVGYAAYFPWILLFSLRLLGRFELSSFTILVILRVLALFIGYPPYFIYTVTFDILAMLLLYFVFANTHPLSRKYGTVYRPDRGGFMFFLIKQGINYLCVALLAAPLLLPAMYQIGLNTKRKAPLNWEEYSLYSYKLSYWLNGLFTPLSDMKCDYWSEQQFLSHIGWLTLLFCVATVWQKSVNRRLVLVFLGLALFAFLWANDTFVTRLFYYLPFYNRQRWPFKLAFFTSFFLVVVASFGFDAWYQRIKGSSVRNRAMLVILLLLHSGNFLVLYSSTPQRVFSNNFEYVPYAEQLQETMKTGRIVTVVPRDARDEGKPVTHSFTFPLLGFNYATIFGLYHFAGYEQLLSEKNSTAALGLYFSADFYVDSDTPFNPPADDLKYFRKWGVKWYILDNKVRFEGSNLLKTVSQDEHRTVLYDAAAKPFVFWQDDPSAGGSDYLFSTNRINVATERKNSGQLLVNVLYNPFFVATVDGRSEKITETADMQILIPIPPGRHVVEIAYVDPYFVTGLYIASLFLVVVFILYGFRGNLGRWVKPTLTDTES